MGFKSHSAAYCATTIMDHCISGHLSPDQHWLSDLYFDYFSTGYMFRCKGERDRIVLSVSEIRSLISWQIVNMIKRNLSVKCSQALYLFSA